jgi:hypothetical protein
MVVVATLAVALGVWSAFAGGAPGLQCEADVKTPGVLTVDHGDGGGLKTPEEAVLEFAGSVADLYPPSIDSDENIISAVTRAVSTDVKSAEGSWLVEVGDRIRVEVATAELPDGTFVVRGAVFC